MGAQCYQVDMELNSDASDIIGVYYIDPSYTVQDPVYGGLKRNQELLTAMLNFKSRIMHGKKKACFKSRSGLLFIKISFLK